MRISDGSSDVCSSDLVGVGIDRKTARRAVFEPLIDRQDDQLAGAAEPALHQDAGEVRLHPRIVAFVIVQNRLYGGRQDRKSVVQGKSVSARLNLGGPRDLQKKTNNQHHNSTLP